MIKAASTFVTPFASEVTPDSALVQVLAPYHTQLAAQLGAKIGVAADPFLRARATSGAEGKSRWVT